MMSDSETKHNDVILRDKTKRYQAKRQNTTMSDSETKHNAVRPRDKNNAVVLRDESQRC